MIRVVLVDDDAMVRTGLRLILSAAPDIEVVGEAADGSAASVVVRRERPDVVLLDVRMPGVDGLTAARDLLADAAAPWRVVMLTTFDLDEYVYGALRAGASGFLLKDAPPEQLIDGIHTVAAGEALLAPSITQRVIQAFVSLPAKPQPMPELDELTAREREVLELLGRGLSNAEIASQLVITQTTTKTHVARVLAKLRLRDRVHAVIYAYEVGIITPGETAGGTRR